MELIFNRPFVIVVNNEPIGAVGSQQGLDEMAEQADELGIDLWHLVYSGTVGLDWECPRCSSTKYSKCLIPSCHDCGLEIER